MPSTRLNKFIAHHGGLSRREADDAIAAGRVTINGAPVALGAQVQLEDVVSLDGSTLERRVQPTVLVFHKPAGYVCSRKQQGDAPTIYDLIPDEYHALKTVGRLDRDSSGIILLTDDGDLAHSMTHPSFHKTKLYEVTLDRALEPLHHQMIVDIGVDLPDGKSSFGLEKLNDNPKTWQITMLEGRNRQIRRTFGALSYTVTALHRTHFGQYALGDISAGQFKTADIA